MFRAAAVVIYRTSIQKQVYSSCQALTPINGQLHTEKKIIAFPIRNLIQYQLMHIFSTYSSKTKKKPKTLWKNTFFKKMFNFQYTYTILAFSVVLDLLPLYFVITVLCSKILLKKQSAEQTRKPSIQFTVPWQTFIKCRISSVAELKRLMSLSF